MLRRAPPVPHHLVVVESPAKAKTIEKYLGKDYTVLASYGHVRDLPSKNGSVDPDNDFAMTYEIDADSKKKVAALTKAAKGIDTLYLATDPDREGEAISWHVLEALQQKKAIKKDTDIKRIAFNAITKTAVTKAITEPREIDMDLVNAQQARRALDYLVGFTLSPVLWRKLPGSRSAGRVQSVALRLICEREAEIEVFKSQEYWDITTTLGGSPAFDAKLSQWNGKKLKKFDISNEAQAKEISEILEGQQARVISVEEKETKRNPYAPFITSTLQMDASRKLGFGAKQTMQIAQKLYEAGLITYMRTDGVTVAPEAIEAARSWIEKEQGKQYLPPKPRIYSSKAKNAQEAHEAIRPTDMFKQPKAAGLSGEQFKLYDLIWKRMLGSQMASAVFDQVAVDFETADGSGVLHATGSVMKFDGFLALYREGKDDDAEGDENDRRLPPLKKGDSLAIEKVIPAQHFTQPPPRYTEASLVKKLEELGIGRPSTYAAILAVLIDRGYVNLDKKRFTPEARGRIVSAFLESFFNRYVEYDFTAQIEEKLDLVSDGKLDWKDLLRDWWKDFHAYIEAAQEVPNPKILEEVDRLLIPYLYGTEKAVEEARICPKCGTGTLSLKTGKFGAFLGCSNYPECNFTKPIAAEADETDDSIIAADGPKSLGVDAETNKEVLLKKGPYGFYVQLGEDVKGEKPKRASLPKGKMPEDMTLTHALELLALPRDVGMHPETGEMITAAIGRYGPYLKHQGKFTSIPAEDDVYTIGINRATAVLAEKKKKSFGPEALHTLGEHPDGGAIEVMKGRYGPYVKHGKTNATLPKEMKPEEVNIDIALELLAELEKKAGGKKKAAKKKPAAKKKTAAKKKA
jgi:DNA topoisomerase-1